MATQDGCLLLTKLPMELREAIYEFAVTSGDDNDPIAVKTKWMESRDAYITCGVEPGLLATCWQIRHEATCIFYRNSSFSIDFPRDTVAFLRQLGPDRIPYVKRLCLYEKYPPCSRGSLTARMGYVCNLANKFARQGLRAKQIKIYTRTSLSQTTPPWQTINEIEEFRADMGHLAVERGWGQGWTFEDSAIEQPKEA